MKAHVVKTADHPHGVVMVELEPAGAEDLEEAIGTVLDALRELDPEREHADQARILLAQLHGQVTHALGHLTLAAAGPAHVPSHPDISHEEPEPTGRPASLPGCDLPAYIDIIASHILPANREYTVRIFHCDFTGRRATNEALARTFPTEAAARTFYGSTQNIQNMKVRNKEVLAIDVVLGVQDKRSHAKKKSYREWEHTLCKGGPG